MERGRPFSGTRAVNAVHGKGACPVVPLATGGIFKIESVDSEKESNP